MKSFCVNIFFGSLLFFLNTSSIEQISDCTACKPSVASASLAKEKKPNILLILTDDQGYEDVSFAGTKDLNTPAIDALREEGMRFTYFYTNSPGLCSNKSFNNDRQKPRQSGCSRFNSY